MKKVLIAMFISALLAGPAAASMKWPPYLPPTNTTTSTQDTRQCDGPTAATPEPGAAVLLASGLLVIGGTILHRRKNKKQ